MTFANAAMAEAFALYAALGGAMIALGLLRDVGARVPEPAAREALIGAIGLAALFAAFMTQAMPQLRLAAGALLLTGLALLALAPRRPERRSPGRRVGYAAAWTGIALSLAGVLFPALQTPISPQ